MNDLMILSAIATAFAALPCALFLRNLAQFHRAPNAPPSSQIGPGEPGRTAIAGPSLSILIPARNEESTIAAAIQSILANPNPDIELLILDDHSTDRTAEIVTTRAANDPRLHLHRAPPLPENWCGKQHACYILSQRAAAPLFLFLDADVRLTPNAVSRLLTLHQQNPTPLLSGFPRQLTASLAEHAVIPLMHFILLGFLPIARMRRSTSPAYSAGCGQLMLITRSAYTQTGGHSNIKNSLHDGITLPHLFRTHQLQTDIFDATDLATCRMYHGTSQVWRGLEKNATEGLATPTKILPVTLILLLGQVLPFILLTLWIIQTIHPTTPFHFTPLARALTLLAIGFAYLPRLRAAARFQQSIMGALLHPLGILLFLTIQWSALGKKQIGHAPTWRGRSYTPAPAQQKAQGYDPWA
jgi:hypothetical protein